jgi:polysaccharide pyruvyl transferase WcaK-like protein
MKTVLLSTSTAWNAGDDWIRDGLLNVLSFQEEVSVLHWNRGWGIEDSFANSLNVNLPHTDYVIMAGTPEWIDRNEALYRHCLHHDKPIALLGVGKFGGYIPSRHSDLMRRVAESGLVEIAIARDEMAKGLLGDFGIEAGLLCDPAVFITPKAEPGEGNSLILGYRGWGKVPSGTVPYEQRDSGPARRTDIFLIDQWASWKDSRRKVTVHDNREIKAASNLFGGRNVLYDSDHNRLLTHYSRASHYVGCRIHGFVASLIHGASAHLIYHTNKAVCAQVIIDRLGLEDSAQVTHLTKDLNAIELRQLEQPDPEYLREKIEEERLAYLTMLEDAPMLMEMTTHE